MAFYERDVDVMIDSAKLQARITELGQQITREYQGKDLTLIGIMKGSVFFLTDLAKAIDLPVTMELMGVSSYHGGTETTGEVRISFDVTKPLNGKHVLIVEDIIDTGLTMKFLLENFAARHPASVKVCTLLEKPARAKTNERRATRFAMSNFTVIVGSRSCIQFSTFRRSSPFAKMYSPSAKNPSSAPVWLWPAISRSTAPEGNATGLSTCGRRRCEGTNTSEPLFLRRMPSTRMFTRYFR